MNPELIQKIEQGLHAVAEAAPVPAPREDTTDKASYPRGENPNIIHIDEWPFIQPSGDVVADLPLIPSEPISTGNMGDDLALSDFDDLPPLITLPPVEADSEFLRLGDAVVEEDTPLPEPILLQPSSPEKTDAGQSMAHFKAEMLKVLGTNGKTAPDGTELPQQMQDLYKQLKVMQRRFPVVAGRVVPVKKRTSKSRKKRK